MRLCMFIYLFIYIIAAIRSVSGLSESICIVNCFERMNVFEKIEMDRDKLNTVIKSVFDIDYDSPQVQMSINGSTGGTNEFTSLVDKTTNCAEEWAERCGIDKNSDSYTYMVMLISMISNYSSVVVVGETGIGKTKLIVEAIGIINEKWRHEKIR